MRIKGRDKPVQDLEHEIKQIHFGILEHVELFGFCYTFEAIWRDSFGVADVHVSFRKSEKYATI